MAFHAWTPPPPLAHWVDLLWVQDEPAPEHARERVLPTGTVQLIIDLNDERVNTPGRSWGTGESSTQYAAGSVLAGAGAEAFVLEWPARAVSLVGASFRPGGAYPFLNVPVGELSGTHVEIEALWGAAARSLRQRLQDARTPLARAILLGEWLLARAVRPLALHPAVSFALDAFDEGRGGVGAVADRVGLSPRRFIELFRNAVGLTPKLFCRVRRFQDALAAVGAGDGVDWVEVALAAGYYDQAHFNHDFRAFSGLTPSAYLSGRSTYQNHVTLA